ncbi:DUF4936 family protein [Pandoraea norimbergensis]|uniref:DUF4936 domain-containing protein n=1 Tax=Pandoraea norimbergensis TaxID=93219 RepID=A0ABM5WM44_9BURK|nr:DUF4936 family protein [Pandoraea norimbergensis]ALS61454.1 hypothetical protein AT302_18425 [Pandoraea norimbergensis]
MDCYVYYRVTPANAEAATQAVTRLFALVASRFGVSARLQWRAETSANDALTGATTWMERYDDVPPAFMDALPAMATQCGLATLVEGERHIECFVDVPSPCA